MVSTDELIARSGEDDGTLTAVSFSAVGAHYQGREAYPGD